MDNCNGSLVYPDIMNQSQDYVYPQRKNQEAKAFLHDQFGIIDDGLGLYRGRVATYFGRIDCWRRLRRATCNKPKKVLPVEEGTELVLLELDSYNIDDAKRRKRDRVEVHRSVLHGSDTMKVDAKACLF